MRTPDDVGTRDLNPPDRDPLAKWLDLVPIAIGLTDSDWNIKAVSGGIQQLIGLSADEAIGRSLLDLVKPTDAAALLQGAESEEPQSYTRTRFQGPSCVDIEVAVFLAPRAEADNGVSFALVGGIQRHIQRAADRVAELELRLERIGEEIRASGVMSPRPFRIEDHPELGQLSTRQSDVFSRLMRGERVSTIARELSISQSTVRNHLAAIFERLAVHSQTELLERFRQLDIS